MVKIYQNLYLGSEIDFVKNQKVEGWSYLQAAKYPFHAKHFGYSYVEPRVASPNDELYVEKPGFLILDLLDLSDPSNSLYSSKQLKSMLTKCFEWLDIQLKSNKVLVHCNYGVSRSPTIVYLYLLSKNLIKSEAEFKKIYPLWNPTPGTKELVKLI